MKGKGKLVLSVVLPLLALFITVSLIIVLSIKKPKEEQVYTFKKDYSILVDNPNVELSIQVYTNKENSLLFNKESIEGLTLIADNFSQEISDFTIKYNQNNYTKHNDTKFYEINYLINFQLFVSSNDLKNLKLYIKLLSGSIYKLNLGRLSLIIDNNKEENSYFKIEGIIPIFSYGLYDNAYRLKELKLKLNKSKFFIIDKIYHRLELASPVENDFYEIEEEGITYLLIKIENEDLILESIPLVFEISDINNQNKTFMYKNSEITTNTFKDLFTARSDIASLAEIESVKYG